MLITAPYIFPLLSPIFIQLTQHISNHGSIVYFFFTVEDIYKLLWKSGIDTTQAILQNQLVYPNKSPQACAAIVYSTTPNLLPHTGSPPPPS